MIEECRRRYEETSESAVSIARDYNVHDVTIRRLAKDLGWIKFPSQIRGVPDDLKLRRRLEAAAAAMQSARAGQRQSKIQTEQGSPATTPDLSPQGAGEREAVPDAALNPAPAATDDMNDAHAAVIRQGIAEVEARLAELTARRIENHPQKATEAHSDSRILANLTGSLRALKAMLGGAPEATGSSYDDLPADLDQFRLELARRIDALFQSEPDRGAGEPADAAAGDQA